MLDLHPRSWAAKNRWLMDWYWSRSIWFSIWRFQNSAGQSWVGSYDTMVWGTASAIVRQVVSNDEQKSTTYLRRNSGGERKLTVVKRPFAGANLSNQTLVIVLICKLHQALDEFSVDRIHRDSLTRRRLYDEDDLVVLISIALDEPI